MVSSESIFSFHVTQGAGTDMEASLELRAKLPAVSGSQTSTTLTGKCGLRQCLDCLAHIPLTLFLLRFSAGGTSSAFSSFKTEPTSMNSSSSFGSGSGSVPGAWPSQSQDGTRTPSHSSNAERLKRALGSPTASGRDKSRRSSPVPAAGNSFGSDLEIIDLTG